MVESKTFKVGRDSKSGEFIPVKVAERRPNTTTVERVPKPGYGDTKPSPKKVTKEGGLRPPPPKRYECLDSTAKTAYT